MPMEPSRSFLLTDLYQLAMMEAYLAAGMTGPAVFEFFARRLPARRGFLVAAGLEQVLDFLEDPAPDAEDLDWLARSGRFGPGFLDYLAGFRFTGEVHAMPEGTPVFPDEPLLRVTAPLPEAQYVETRIINILHYQTLVASKAARVTLAAPGKTLVDFGLRRAHGAEAGLFAARASHLAGFAGSATVLAEARFGVPAYGTMAHSFVEAHDDEEGAFLDFARARPEGVVLLIDTYDTEAGARKAVRAADRLAAEGIAVAAVRLDSGDLLDLSRRVRAILDAGGHGGVGIFASGGLDEDEIAALEAAGAPIDGYGVGTSLTTSSDAPALDCAYKLMAYAGQARRKLSPGKATWPGAKQVFRRIGPGGEMAGDLVALDGEEDATGGGAPLISPVMAAGRRLAPSPALGAVRARCAAGLAALPAAVAAREAPAPYPVEISAALRALAAETDRRLAGA